MHLLKTEEKASCYSNSIIALRARFEEELFSARGKKGLLYHAIDVERVRTEDWQVKRFLLENDGDEEVAFGRLLASLQWKQSFGVHSRSDAYFPLEFWLMYRSEVSGRDLAGRLIWWQATKEVRHFPETALLARQFYAHTLEKADRLVGELGGTFIGDTKGASLAHVDHRFEQFKFSLLPHYPRIARAVYLVDLPWVFSGLIRLILGWMEPSLRNCVRCVPSSALPLSVVDQELTPVSLGGSRKCLELPKGLLPLEKLAHKFDLSEEFVKRFYHVTGYPRAKN